MMIHQSFLREQEEVTVTAMPSAYPIQMEGWQFACLPCDSHSVDVDSNVDYDSVDFDNNSDLENSDIDSSFQSRASTSPMAMAMSIALLRNKQEKEIGIDANMNTNMNMNMNMNMNNSMSKSMKKKQRQWRRQQQRAGLLPPQYSQSGEKLPCRFFQSNKGCRKGSSCPFDHSV